MYNEFHHFEPGVGWVESGGVPNGAVPRSDATAVNLGLPAGAHREAQPPSPTPTVPGVNTIATSGPLKLTPELDRHVVSEQQRHRQMVHNDSVRKYPAYYSGTEVFNVKQHDLDIQDEKQLLEEKLEDEQQNRIAQGKDTLGPSMAPNRRTGR